MKAVIFDFDGTIADTGVLTEHIIKMLSKEYGREPLNKKEVEELRKLSYAQIIKKHRIPARAVPKIIIRVPQIINERIHTVKPHEGMIELVKSLSNIDGLIIGVLSSNTRRNINTFLANNKVRDKFNFVNTGVSLYGKQAKIRQALRRLKIKPEDAIYVGDEVRDIQAAKKVPMKIIAVPWGLNHASLLKKHNPDYLINKPSTIEKIVKTQLL